MKRKNNCVSYLKGNFVMNNQEIIGMPRCDIEELKSKIKHLNDLLSNQDKEVESLRDKLDIAVKALENIEEEVRECLGCNCDIYEIAQEALAKIKGDK